MSPMIREAASRGAHGLMSVVGLALIVLVAVWLASTPAPPVDWHCPAPVVAGYPCMDVDAR